MSKHALAMITAATVFCLSSLMVMAHNKNTGS